MRHQKRCDGARHLVEVQLQLEGYAAARKKVRSRQTRQMPHQALPPLERRDAPSYYI